MEKRADETDVFVIDTPGQIEVFNWSASGTIILDSIASTIPTIVLYIVDTARCESPITFMSNMMYSCSVLYKSKLPFVLCFNKTDVRSPDECIKWMEDYDSYCDAAMVDETYMASLSRSCGLAMMEFYKNLRKVGISAANGSGYDDLMEKLREAEHEYNTDYKEWLQHHKDDMKKLNTLNAEAEKTSFKKFTDDIDMATIPEGEGE
eukprot:GHVO01004259.1.p1 GENE.GHVO01004259.1~~GHVO01004259.1.p1  ORF type:complete len:206 (+),score=38.81 GHVO01004259.1:3-620(+)